MPIQKLCPILEHKKLNDFAYSMTLEVGAEMAGQVACGQFVHVKCGEGLLLRRPISICDFGATTIRMVYEVRGEGTQWLSQRRVGERIDTLGSLGHGFDLSGKRVLLVGGGIGVPPMLACAKEIAGRGDAVHGAFGFRDVAHLMLTDEMSDVCGDVAVISDDGTTGRKGYVTELVAELLAKHRFDAVLACGPKGMLKGVAQLAMDAGIPCQVSMEERMGCGVGACLVCACKTSDGHQKHVCKDGPVFDAKEVYWND